ncbi:hypothetical protein ACLKA7_009400 [Drosophila subpalustris]
MVCKWVRCGRDVGGDMGFCGCKRQVKPKPKPLMAIPPNTPHESGYVLTVPDLVGGLTLPQSPQQQQ